MKRTSFSLIPLATLLLTSCGERPDETPAPGAGEVEAVGRELVDIEEGYILAADSPIPPEGSVRITETTFSLSEGAMSLRMGDEVMEGTMEVQGASTERIVGLSPDSARWTLDASSEKTTLDMMGEVEQQIAEEDPLLGKTSLIERDASGVWSIRLEDGEADEEIEDTLTEQLNSLVAKSGRSVEVEMFGEAPRMPGDSWEVDVADVFHSIHNIDSPEGTITVSFDHVEESEAGDVAILSYVIDVSGFAADEEGTEISTTGTGQIRRCLVELTTLEDTLTGQLSVSSEAMPGMVVTFKGPFETKMTTTISTAE